MTPHGKKVLAVIPARGGSKGIPGKNIKIFAGRPLLAWTVDAAKQCSAIDRTIVSTDDSLIAQVATACGAEVPFMRPHELALDDTPGVLPIMHAAGEIPGYDFVVVLQPTSPLRTSDDISKCIALAEKSLNSTSTSVTEADQHPAWMYRIDIRNKLQKLFKETSADRRQDLEKAYCLNGAIYVAGVPFLLNEKTLVAPGTLGYVMPRERSLDIDDMLDWKIAEILLKETL